MHSRNFLKGCALVTGGLMLPKLVQAGEASEATEKQLDPFITWYRKWHAGPTAMSSARRDTTSVTLRFSQAAEALDQLTSLGDGAVHATGSELRLTVQGKSRRLLLHLC